MRIGKKEHARKENNKGYTLIELIVVIAIMTVMVGGVSIGISLMFSRDAQSAAVTIDNQLSEVRMLSMSKPGDYTMTVQTTSDYSNSNKIIIDDGDATTDPYEVVIDKKVKISVSQENGDGSFTTTDGGDIEIAFDKGNGSVSSVNGPASGVYVFRVQQGKGVVGRTATVTLVATTGRHYTEK